MYDEIDHRREGECHRMGGICYGGGYDMRGAAQSISGIGVSV